jgi:hypothetical protein
MELLLIFHKLFIPIHILSCFQRQITKNCGNSKLSMCRNSKFPRNMIAEGFDLFSFPPVSNISENYALKYLR